MHNASLLRASPVCLLLLLSTGETWGEDQKINPLAVAEATLPLMRKIPAIDGAIAEEEWAEAVRIAGVVDLGSGALHPRAATTWFGCDGQHEDATVNTYGTWIPYLWIGGPDRGICCFSDTDRDWVLDDGTPAIDLFREDGVVNLRVHFINTPARLMRTHRIVFGLQRVSLLGERPTPFHRGTRGDCPRVESGGQGSDAGDRLWRRRRLCARSRPAGPAD